MQLTINGNKIQIMQQDLGKNLLQYLREDLDLTGTKNGCNIGVCGACTVLINNKPTRACKQQLQDVANTTIITIEGLAHPDGTLHPLQQAFIDRGAIQCGFCTPGVVLTAHALLLNNTCPSREQIRQALAGNLCRCTGYQQIVDAIEYASRFYA